jgi:cobalamin-dependent methionine synthase-like protein
MMRDQLAFDAATVRPSRQDALNALGMSADDDASARLLHLLADAETLFDRLVQPVVVIEQITPDEFAHIYAGEGANAPASPLELIYPRADALALFAGTLGAGVDDGTRQLFHRDNAALGYIVDVMAALAADRLAYLAAERFHDALRDDGGPAVHVLPYSTGYCGWHVSGQRTLFARLRADEIGIALTASCVMDPIKSVSGVLVAGKADVHRFRPDYPFCEACTTHECRARMGTLT